LGAKTTKGAKPPYPAMKKEYERNSWTWKRIYDIEVNNRRSYRELAGIIWTAIKGK